MVERELKTNQPEPREDIVVGRNAVIELLRSGREIECVFLQRSLPGVNHIAAMAKEKKLVVKDVAAAKLDHLCGHGAHQGIAAQLAAARYAELEDLFKRAEASGEPPFFLLADGIEDPHNLGAIIRTAEASGAHGLIVPKRHSAGLGYTVAKTSAGAVEHLPVVRVPNLVATIEELKKRGVWMYAADMAGESWCPVDYSGGVGLVLGAEGSGVSRLAREKCDFLVSLPMRGKIESLNVSVAAGIICYEIARQRMGISSFGK
jgi:23S rRNA (guanosine2251-2'-O)-methyltransferase